MLCFVLANLATVAGESWVPKCQAWTAIPLTLWDISERQGRCYSEVVLFHFLGSNRTGFVEIKCCFNLLVARGTYSSLPGGLHFQLPQCNSSSSKKYIAFLHSSHGLGDHQPCPRAFFKGVTANELRMLVNRLCGHVI